MLDQSIIDKMNIGSFDETLLEADSMAFVDTLIEQVDMLLEHEDAEEGLAGFLVRTYPGEGFLHHFIKAVLVKQFEVRQHSIDDLTIYDLTIYD